MGKKNSERQYWQYIKERETTEEIKVKDINLKIGNLKTSSLLKISVALFIAIVVISLLFALITKDNNVSNQISNKNEVISRVEKEVEIMFKATADYKLTKTDIHIVDEYNDFYVVDEKAYFINDYGEDKINAHFYIVKSDASETEIINSYAYDATDTSSESHAKDLALERIGKNIPKNWKLYINDSLKMLNKYKKYTNNKKGDLKYELV